MSGRELTSSIQGDRFEITGGKLAQTRSQNAQVRALRARLVKDHSKSLREAIAMCHRFNISVPKAPSQSERWELSMVGALSGQAFDKAYTTLEVADHHQDLGEAGDEVTDGTDHEVRSSVHKEIPILRTHLHLSEAALKAVRRARA